MHESLTLRPATPGDRPFLLTLYASTRAAELALTGWDETLRLAFVRMQFDAQARSFATQFPAARCDVIECHDQAVGRFWVDRGTRGFCLLDITLLPGRRGRGIGSHCIRRLLAEAGAAGLPVRLHVDPANPALRLYERLGFRAGAEHGLHRTMDWQPGVCDPLTGRACGPVEVCDGQA